MKPLKIVPIICFLFLSIQCIGQQNGFVSSSDSASIYFRTYGSGMPLLIINGGPGMNSNGFEGLAAKLSNKYKVILYDQRGTGLSHLNRLDTNTITMKLMLDDIESLRKYLKLDSWSILGQSFGGMLASYYATQYPEHLDKMILSSSGGIDLDLLNYVDESIRSKLDKSELDSLAYWTKKITAGDTSHVAKLGRGRALAPAYLINKKYIPVLAERLTQGNQTVNILIWTDLRKINYNCAEQLRTYDKPVLIIQGKEDIIRPETAKKAQKVLKNSKLVFMENCGHYGWLDNEEVYFKEINSLLASNN